MAKIRTQIIDELTDVSEYGGITDDSKFVLTRERQSCRIDFSALKTAVGSSSSNGTGSSTPAQYDSLIDVYNQNTYYNQTVSKVKSLYNLIDVQTDEYVTRDTGIQINIHAHICQSTAKNTCFGIQFNNGIDGNDWVTLCEKYTINKLDSVDIHVIAGPNVKFRAFAKTLNPTEKYADNSTITFQATEFKQGQRFSSDGESKVFVIAKGAYNPTAGFTIPDKGVQESNRGYVRARSFSGVTLDTIDTKKGTNAKNVHLMVAREGVSTRTCASTVGAAAKNVDIITDEVYVEKGDTCSIVLDANSGTNNSTYGNNAIVLEYNTIKDYGSDGLHITDDEFTAAASAQRPTKIGYTVNTSQTNTLATTWNSLTSVNKALDIIGFMHNEIDDGVLQISVDNGDSGSSYRGCLLLNDSKDEFKWTPRYRTESQDDREHGVSYNITILDNSKLNSISFANSVSQRSYGVNLTGISSLGDSITSIPDYAFCGCTKLSSLNLKDANIREFSTLSTFLSCKSLVELKLPTGAKYGVANRTFSGCSSLTSINLEEVEGFDTMGMQTFQGCSSLTSLNLSNISSIDSANCGNTDPFSNMKNLAEVTFDYQKFTTSPGTFPTGMFNDTGIDKHTLIINFVNCTSTSTREDIAGKLEKLTLKSSSTKKSNVFCRLYRTDSSTVPEPTKLFA